MTEDATVASSTGLHSETIGASIPAQIRNCSSDRAVIDRTYNGKRSREPKSLNFENVGGLPPPESSPSGSCSDRAVIVHRHPVTQA